MRQGRFQPKKSRGAIAPGIMEEEGGLGASHPANFLTTPFFALRKRPILAQRLVIYARKSCKNERANMKESRQNDREIKSTGQ